MTKTQAFVDGFVGKPIKNECFNLWDLNAIIREKHCIKRILNLERNKLKKSQKQKTPNTIKQENQNKENPSQTFNTQLNFLMENELNAIGKLPKDLADGIVTMLEKSLEYKKDNDNKILDLENKNIEIRKND
ncbi:TPA: hypothetical protein ACJISN_001765 [Campylobacter coli]